MTGRFNMLEQVLTAVHVLNEPRGASKDHIANFVMDRMDGLLREKRNEIRAVSVRIRNDLKRKRLSTLSNRQLCNDFKYSTSSALKHYDNTLGIRKESLRRRSSRISYSKRGKRIYLKRCTVCDKYDEHMNCEQSSYNSSSEESY